MTAAERIEQSISLPTLEGKNTARVWVRIPLSPAVRAVAGRLYGVCMAGVPMADRVSFEAYLSEFIEVACMDRCPANFDLEFAEMWALIQKQRKELRALGMAVNC